MHPSILPGFAVILITRKAALSPPSARVFKRTLLHVVSAVSAEEKKAEKIKRHTKVTILTILSGSILSPNVD